MDQNSKENEDTKNKFIYLIKKHRNKLFILIFSLLLFFSFFIFLKYHENKKNIDISEKYIQAGIYLTSNKDKKAKEIYEEIVRSKNKFYSILAINVLVEKNLERDESKILNYFKIAEDIADDKNQKALIIFKKALYLIKVSKIKEGKELLQNLSNSNLKPLIKEILDE